MFPVSADHSRKLLARSFAAHDTIVKQADGTYKVSSLSRPGEFHVVRRNGACTCEAHANGIPCRHATLAAYTERKSRAAKELRHLALLAK
jgi:hypothetical protein